MHKILTKLNQETVVELYELQNRVQFVNTDRRLGSSGLQKMSVYSYSKWKTWNRIDVSSFKGSFDKSIIDKSIIGWFLKFPPNTGFLDLMTTWVGKDSGVISAFSLEDNQKIWLDGKEITVNKGEGIEFSLSVPHEIKSEKFEQKWACLMSLK